MAVWMVVTAVLTNLVGFAIGDPLSCIEGKGKVGHTNGDSPFLIQANGVGAASAGGPCAFFSCFGGKLTGTVNLAVVAFLLGAHRGGCHQGELAGAAG